MHHFTIDKIMNIYVHSYGQNVNIWIGFLRLCFSFLSFMIENIYTAIQYLIWTGTETLLKTALSCWLQSIFPEWKIYKYRLFFQMCYCFMFFCRQGLKAKKRVTKLVFVVIIVFIGKFNYTIYTNSQLVVHLENVNIQYQILYAVLDTVVQQYSSTVVQQIYTAYFSFSCRFTSLLKNYAALLKICQKTMWLFQTRLLKFFFPVSTV